MLRPLVLIPAFLGTAIYAIATTGPVPSTLKTSVTSSSTPSVPAPTEAPPLADRALADSFDPLLDPVSIPAIPNCQRYACYVECRVAGVVTPNCRGCCA
ncbi:hypothetical protein PG999_014189 [Apiospora kogelbergensis]|uniref:Uncharacterized protein n=1 Tax=Apiospora kogelbergensis TaxID=1337665 RepID=A0AAW0QAD7_9PEZI